MAKRYKINTIKSKSSYTYAEIAELLDIHTRTVQEWGRSGLQVLEGTKSPYLVMGEQLKQFLKSKQSKRRITLGSGEFYCLVCRRAVTPVAYEEVSNGIVGGGITSLRLKSTCPNCTNIVNKFATKESVSKTK